MKYPYLAASLPTLSLDVMPQTTLPDFVRQCAGVLSEEDFQELAALLADDRLGCGSAFAADWFVFETSFRHLIAEVRAGRLGLDPRTAIGYRDEGVTLVKSAVVDAFAKSNPFEREWSLDQSRWYVLDDLARQDPFGLNAVLAHALKLKLAHRWSSMNDEKGIQNLNRNLDAILESNPLEAE